MRWLLSVVLFVCLSNTVVAKGPFNQFQVGNWQAGIWTFDDSDEFSHCSASVGFKSRLTLFVAVTRDIEWSIGIVNPDWNLVEGQSYSVNLTFDRQFTFNVVGQAKMSDFMVIPMPNEDDIVNAFRAGRLMDVVAIGKTYGFALNGTSRLLTELVSCAKLNIDKRIAGSNASPNDGKATSSVPSGKKSDAEEEKDRLLSEAVAEHKLCLTTQMKDLVPYSTESAEVLAQVILTNCVEAEKKVVSYGIALFGNTRAESEKIVSEILAEQKKKMVADIVTFRAEIAKSLLNNDPKKEATPATPVSPSKPGI